MNINTRNAFYRQELSCFIERSFMHVDPASKFSSNWHIDLIADRLTKAYNGKIKRLIINIPPRYLKSICVSVAWPAWILGNKPSARIMTASYSQLLSTKHSIDCRNIIESPWYEEIFSDIKLASDQNEKNKFMTTERGFRFATSVGGTATGEGGDFLIVDDPHNPLQAASDVQRQNAIEWFNQTFMSRLNDKKKGVIVVVMQRLHADDLTGHLLDKAGNKWTHICLPAIAPKAKKYYYFSGCYYRKEGELLHIKREGIEEIEMMKLNLGSNGFASQYQQCPIISEGAMVKRSWFARYKNLPKGEIMQSWDTAIKSGKENDYSVCTTWLQSDNAYYLVDCFAEKMEYPDLKRAILSHAQKYSPNTILIEDKASGQSLIQDLRRETKLPIIAINPKNDKMTRFASVTPLMEAGKVMLPDKADWLIDYETELFGFPQVSHDDRVDSTSQFLSWAQSKRNISPRVRAV
ncbi:phage terminase large subunit [Rickettsiales bacterium]|nr:phage terminase large subunit [Rickettsiales bacterium]